LHVADDLPQSDDAEVDPWQYRDEMVILPTETTPSPHLDPDYYDYYNNSPSSASRTLWSSMALTLQAVIVCSVCARVLTMHASATWWLGS
jgi:hypothetical protein